MSLVNCKVELKLKWMKDFVLSVLGTGNADDNYTNFVVTYQKKRIKNYQNFSAKALKRSLYWNEYETKSENNSVRFNGL